MASLALAPRALYEEVAEQLRQRIFRRDLEPGSWIDEVKLAHEYGISRTPLREALKVLAAEGLVTMKVRRGAYVTEVSDRDLAEVYHLLGLLESDAAAAVASNASEQQLAQLEALHGELEAVAAQDAADGARFLQLNLEFHAQLIAIADNRWREQMVNDLRKMTRLHGHQSMFKSGRIAQALAEHRALLAALRSRDPEAAMQRMREHFQSGLEAAL